MITKQNWWDYRCLEGLGMISKRLMWFTFWKNFKKIHNDYVMLWMSGLFPVWIVGE